MAFWVCFNYLFTPITVKRTLWVDPNSVPTIDSASIEDWPDVAELLQVGEQIEGKEFQKEELLIFDNMMPNSMLFVQPFRNLEDVCSSAVTIVLSKVLGTWKVTESKIEFETCFSDDSVVTTIFALNLEIIGSPEGRQYFFVTWTHDPEELLAIHNRLIGYLGPGKQKVDPVERKYGGNMSRFILHSMRDEWERHRAAGIFYLEDEKSSPEVTVVEEPINPYAPPISSPRPGRLYLSFKGAYVLTWGILFPIKQIRRWGAGRKTKGVLRRC